jgi:hypothetical protein
LCPIAEPACKCAYRADRSVAQAGVERLSFGSWTFYEVIKVCFKSDFLSGTETGMVDELSEEDKLHIREVFAEEIEPRLIRMQARIGTLNCDFAGEKHKDWILYFKSNRSGFEIVDFEYDDSSRSIKLAQKNPFETL